MILGRSCRRGVDGSNDLYLGGMTPIIRLAGHTDAASLPDVERSAGESFRTLPDLAWIADDDVGSADVYPARIAEGTLWIAEVLAEIAGFLSAQRFDNELHIWELAVAQPFQRRGLGRLLLDAAQRHARHNELDALTLTTFRQVAWNALFYARYGFRLLDDVGTGPRLTGLLRREAAHGLPDRCAMRLPL
jgi:GNAT superfamily N-acetyltransferase